ncbi:class I SAM-dependent methyltransferase [bacterium]|nr:class I SAM-dependent methyltransferase [bacterium]
MKFNLDLLKCLDRGLDMQAFSGIVNTQGLRTHYPNVQALEVRDGIVCFMSDFDDYTENYDQICTDDLMIPKTPSEVKRIFTRLVEERSAGMVCDLGCGDGYVIQRIESQHRIAIDIALEYLKRLPDSILRIWSRAEQVPLVSSCLDTVVCTDLIEHVVDAQLLAREIKRILKPNGRILMAFPFEQDLTVYNLPEYKLKYGKYRYVHLRSITDGLIAQLFPEFDVCFEHLITEGMKFMEFRPYPIKFVELARKQY